MPQEPSLFDRVDFAAAHQAEPAPAAQGGHSVGGFFDNVASSASNALMGTVNTVLHPIDTYHAVERGKDAVNAAALKQIGDFKAMSPAQQRDEVRPRLGNIGHVIAQTADRAYQDPVGTALNVAAVLPPGAISGAVTRITNALGKSASDAAPRLVQAAVKPTVSELRTQSGASASGLQGQANRVTGLLLRSRLRTPEQAGSVIRDAESQLQGVLDSAGDVGIDTASRVPRYLSKLERSAAQQAMPSDDVATVRSAAGRVMAGPLAEDVTTTVMTPSPSGIVDEFGRPVQVPTAETSRAMRTDVSPREGLDIARATGRWNNRKSWGELKGAEQEASKATERAIRDSVKEAVPAAKPILQKQSDALTLYPILDRMALRQGNRDVIGLPAWIGAASGGLGARTLMGTAGQVLRNSQLPLGYAAADLGKFLMQNAGRTGAVAPGLLRAALMAALANEGTEQPPTPETPR